MTSSVVAKKLGGTSNGRLQDLQSTKVDSDSATPETGDEASDKLGLDEDHHLDEKRNQLDSRKLEEKVILSPRQPLESMSSEEIVFEEISPSSSGLSGSSTKRQTEDGKEEAERKSAPFLSRFSQRRKSDEDGEEGDSDDQASASSQKQDSLLWEARMYSGKLVNNEYVQIAIISLILINAFMMGVATFDFVTENPNVDNVFGKIDRGFLIIFTIEAGMQLFYLGVGLFSDGWLVFDLLIVIFSWSFESLQIVRAFRIFRAFRLITRVKPLRDLVLAVGAVLPRMYAIAALLMLIFYIFSVLFTELFSDLPLSDNYFTTLDASLFTCMEMMTLEWGEIAREVMLHHSWAWAPFTAFILITGFIVFNLIVAVVCDAVAVTEKTVRELDGFEEDTPETKLAEAQERIDVLQSHINDMMTTQASVHKMIDIMASELLRLETERLKAEDREAELRLQVERRAQFERDMETRRQMETQERNHVLEMERRENEKKLESNRRASMENLAEMINNVDSPRKKQHKFIRPPEGGLSRVSSQGSRKAPPK